MGKIRNGEWQMNGMKQIMADYFSAYKISRLKGKGTDGLFFLAYFIAMPVFIGINGTVNFNWNYMLIFTGIFLPMCLSVLGIRLRSPGLDKMRYLCPMSREERKKYIYGIYGFGIGVRMIISLMGVCLVLFVSHCSPLRAVVILLNDFLIAGLLASDGDRREEWSGEVLLWIWILVLSMISNIVEVGILADEIPDTFVQMALFLIFLLIQLPMAVKYRKYVRQRLDDAVYYETWQRRAV